MMDYMDRREGDLDALIKSHRTYLDRVVKKVLLLGAKTDKEEILLDQVREAMEYILQFRDTTVSKATVCADDRMSYTHGLWLKRQDWTENEM